MYRLPIHLRPFAELRLLRLQQHLVPLTGAEPAPGANRDAGARRCCAQGDGSRDVMRVPFDQLSDSEKEIYRSGQDSVLNDLFNMVAELEESRNRNSSHGKAQLYILREIVRRLCSE